MKLHVDSHKLQTMWATNTRRIKIRKKRGGVFLIEIQTKTGPFKMLMSRDYLRNMAMLAVSVVLSLGLMNAIV